jgi:D-alanyl-D-alanine dipeptidase
VPISTDQMYTNFGVTDEKTIKKIKNQHEAAAITMAKQAVQSYVSKHPDSKFPELKGSSNDKANVEIDLGETADFKSQINDMSEAEDAEPNYVLSVDDPANKQQLSQKMESADTSIPKWPSYNQPV